MPAWPLRTRDSPFLPAGIFKGGDSESARPSPSDAASEFWRELSLVVLPYGQKHYAPGESPPLLSVDSGLSS